MEVCKKNRSLRKEVLIERRKQLQKKVCVFNAFQHAKKIQLNSAYGAL
mgnify:CR=1 FL=1